MRAGTCLSQLGVAAGGTSQDGGGALLFAEECVWMQSHRRATPADLPSTSSVLGAGLNQPAKTADSPHLGLEPVWGFAQPCLAVSRCSMEMAQDPPLPSVP